jgi:hypothetical protein
MTGHEQGYGVGRLKCLPMPRSGPTLGAHCTTSLPTTGGAKMMQCKGRIESGSGQAGPVGSAGDIPIGGVGVQGRGSNARTTSEEVRA